jgi:hypothetical protein
MAEMTTREYLDNGQIPGLTPSPYLLSRNLRSLSKKAVADMKPVHSTFSDLVFTLMLHNSINNLEYPVHITRYPSITYFLNQNRLNKPSKA